MNIARAPAQWLEAHVTHYRIFEFSSQSHIQKSHDITAPDDITALEQAMPLASKATVEVWESARMIARIGNDGEAVP